MSRQTDIHLTSTAASAGVDLPIIDWASIGRTAPTPIPTPARQSTDPLPAADIVVITWTSAEWSALDHVFANSGSTRSAGVGEWADDWLPYAHNTGSFSSGEDSEPLWGTFRLVSVAGASQNWTVLLFHSNAHLQYQPYIAGLRAMVNNIITDAKPKYLYSAGTAGAGTLAQMLGDPVVTNGAELLAGLGPNASDSANGDTFTCTTWYPSGTLFTAAQSLMFPLAHVVSTEGLKSLFSKLSRKVDVGSVTFNDLLNAPLQPANLVSPLIHSMQGVPLNTSCDFSMAPGAGSTQFSAFEEDDAVVGQVAEEMSVNFAFVRNVSDTVIPDQNSDGPISDNIRQAWAGDIYDQYGLITATNGAIATWAAIAAT